MKSAVKSIDHFVVAVKDVEVAGRAYETLGFQVLPLMRHIELGTCNRIVQLRDTYLELIGDFDKAIPELRDFYLPRFQCGEGLAAVSLTSSDLARDRLRYLQMGFSPDPIRSARRRVVMPDGRAEETASDFMGVWRQDRRYASFFLTHHHKPETIWIPGYMRHANTARRVTRITYVSDQLSLDGKYFGDMVGALPRRQDIEDVVLATGREEIEIMPPKRLTARFGAASPGWCSQIPAYGIALRLQVDDLAQCHRALVENAVGCIALDGRLQVPADRCHGVVLEFVGGDAG